MTLRIMKVKGARFIQCQLSHARKGVALYERA
jgi:hypothetical protein